MNKSSIFLFFFVSVVFSCRKDHVPREFISENLIVVFIDGPRMSETWDEPFRSFIPFQDSLAQFGTLLNNLRNNGETKTVPGHVAVCTGNYQSMNNTGTELPTYPSFFQYWRKEHKENKNKAWIITSKDKLEVLSNCTKNGWKDQFLPSTDCGIAGNGTGYRHDSITLNVLFQKLTTYTPKIVLVNFREPDYSGHQNNWIAYLNGIKNTDKYIDSIWKHIQNDPHYKNKTTLIVTNDHGRHLDNSGGFQSHGDGCLGCRKLSLLVLGPDIKKGNVISTEYDQLDLNATIGHLLNVKQKFGTGHIITPIFND